MSRFRKLFRATAAAALTAFGAAPATAQQPVTGRPVVDEIRSDGVAPASFGRTPRSAPAPVACPPGCQPLPCPPAPYPGAPSLQNPQYQPTQPPTTQLPTTQPPTTPMPVTQSPVTGSTVGADAGGGFPEFAARGRGAGAGPTVGLNGYIENAAPVTQFRMRYDSVYNSNRPDRGEFFYAKCGCFRGLPANNPLFDPNAKGPPMPETSVDAQELTPYLEYAVNPRLSMFVSIPIRFINPEVNRNAAGLSDVSFGAKYAFVSNEKRIVSFLLQTIAPSGDVPKGLGTGNWWIEPGVLWLEQMSPQWQVFGEIRDRIYLSRQSDFTGNVLRYGIGTSYVVASGKRGYVAPVVEAVGWTFLNGKEANESGVVSAAGDTIVNAKFGLRIGFGAVEEGQPYPTRSDLYIGYGRALTGEWLYKDLLRVEYRLFF